MRKALQSVQHFAVFVVTVLVFSVSARADIVVTAPPPNALDFANMLVGGTGITVLSASYLGGVSTTGTQGGTFTRGTGILPFDSGLILTSGLAQYAPGPNTVPDQTYDWQANGLPELDALAGYSTADATRLTFTVIPTASVISFQFVFASEEYNEWVGSPYNDVFAFILNGVNIAVVPGTSTPIAVNTVDCSQNSAYYTNNDPFDGTTGGCSGNVASPLNTQYDGLAGLAHPLFARGNVNAGVENTIELAIADSSDHVLDSAVFLAAGTFKDEEPPDDWIAPVPEPSAVLLLATAVSGPGWKFRKSLSTR